ncbi:MAG: tRNA (N6-isopentenyl adenosine(37)-C2)-methylthiotransferase MiaB [Treponema sp.]|nr:tRNA (N6-isopentenyl adenosine(37)-C2)-methylthiotransferase MiaB [Treponema sp.]
MTYFFETYGCEMNIAESASMEQLLIARGWAKAASAQVADMMIVNTCSIRKSAEERIEGRLGWINGLKAVREKKTGAKTKLLDEAVEYVKDGAKPLTVVVTGCMAERLLPTFKQQYPFVDFVVGTYAKHHFGKIIEAVEEGRADDVSSVPDDSGAYQFAAVSAEPGAFSTFVPIMHGCNNFCTYCIVPYVRGREISRPVEQILQELDILKKLKVCEITLIGQNVNSYNGVDTAGQNVNFAGLLKIIAEHLRKTESTIRWVRFMSSHPKDFTDDVIDVIASEPVLCRHIHLPVQNGSTPVLKAMNRRYTREQYLELVAKIKAKIPEVSLTTDIMMGFPGETEEDVEQTLDLMKQVKYESAMMYFYNPREGTPAAKMEQLPEEVRKERLQRVIDLQLEHTQERMKERVGNTVLVLAEGVSRDDSTELLGQTEQHEKIVFKADRKLIGSFVNVKINQLNGNTFKGELV